MIRVGRAAFHVISIDSMNVIVIYVTKKMDKTNLLYMKSIETDIFGLVKPLKQTLDGVDK